MVTLDRGGAKKVDPVCAIGPLGKNYKIPETGSDGPRQAGQRSISAVTAVCTENLNPTITVMKSAIRATNHGGIPLERGSACR